jgi:di/tricarboxylate transporter
MTIAIISLVSLVLAIAIGFWKNVNVGLIALVFSLIVGYFIGGIPIDTIISYWPLKLFFTTFGVTLLFGITKLNGTLQKVSNMMIYQSHGKTILIVIVFYFLSLILASIGPGNISTGALLLPIGLALAYQAKIPMSLMSIMIINGAIAGGLSPIAPNGIVALQLALENGVGDLGFRIYLTHVLSMTTLSILLFFLLGGLKLKGNHIDIEKPEKLNKDQIITLICIVLLIVWVMVFGVNVGFASIVFATFLLILKSADPHHAIQSVAWTAITLICGTAVLISVISELGGVSLLTTFLANLMNKGTAIPILALLSGVMSMFSSAVGVVMPTLIPTAVELSDKLNHVISPAVITITIAIGSHFVTISPFSTMGALAIASAPEVVDRKKLFNQLFAYAFVSLAFIAIFLWILGLLGILV